MDLIRANLKSMSKPMPKILILKTLKLRREIQVAYFQSQGAIVTLDTSFSNELQKMQMRVSWLPPNQGYLPWSNLRETI